MTKPIPNIGVCGIHKKIGILCELANQNFTLEDGLELNKNHYIYK